MVELYCKLIIAKSNRTFDRVPDNFKPQVEARLLELGYDINGDKIVSE